ncbi:MAG: hypothetical protein LC753_16695 [Acidobacteria bacterium]|nr:hypothetical protein [Acidobacteriota bacterium]MCA1651830.1 hypothetical protein [Acidobacteriota bacterium]
MMPWLVAAAVTWSVPAFIESARAGTDKYRDQAAAIRDGYRRIGRDFPAMGEHWIRINLVFDGTFDASRPEVLNYVVIDGKPRLLGVGYAVPLLGGESPPSGPVGADAWHDHFRTIEDETVLPHHHMGGAAQDSPRLAMMHAWIWSPNPEGVFAADNWTIPYLRLGLTPAAGTPSSVAKALSLASGGRDYFERSIDAASAMTPTEKGRVKDAVDRAQAAVLAVLQNNRAAGLSGADVTRLTAIWTEIWTAMDGAVGADARQRLTHLPIR